MLWRKEVKKLINYVSKTNCNKKANSFITCQNTFKRNYIFLYNYNYTRKALQN